MKRLSLLLLTMLTVWSCSITPLDKEEQELAVNGINCWDLNQNGQNDPEEDVNADGVFDVLDCRGANGEDGEDGTDGSNGEDGADGEDGQDGSDGNDGADGNDGQDGTDGQNGENGSDGQDGEDGQDAKCFVIHDDVATFQDFAEGTIVNKTGFISVYGERKNFNGNQAMVFDSNRYTGGDSDLDVQLGHILIISEDNDSSDPDDNASGGIFYFDFNFPVTLESVDVVDIENNKSFLEVIQADGTLTVINVPKIGDLNVRTINIDIENVVSFAFDIRGSGAIDNIATEYKEEINCH